MFCSRQLEHEVGRELRAFFSFLDREDCVQELYGNAEEELADLLADPDNYGMAKSLMMTARAQGFDIHTEQGLRAFMQHIKAPPRAAPPPTPEKKKKRKAERKARWRSR